MLLMALIAVGQEIPPGYNPFVPANLDNPDKLSVAPVVEGSYHRYWIAGDPNYTDTSTFVWYVENGALGYYDPATDNWAPISMTTHGNGYIAELPGDSLDGRRNASQIWVLWDTGAGGETGYIAVYERSYDNCVVVDQLTGYKHNIVLAPQVWFLVGNREECADQVYSVTVRFNHLTEFSFPYILTYTHPGNDGFPVSGELEITGFDLLDASMAYTFDLEAVQDLDVTIDELYTVRLESLRDKYGANGLIAPLGPPQQYAWLQLTIYHLPQTGGMTMD
jgi:hypothetical protein